MRRKSLHKNTASIDGGKMVLRRMIAFFLSVAALCFFSVGSYAAEKITYEVPEIPYARMGLLYEETTDTLMFLRKEDLKNAPASMTKIMTAILVLEHDPDLSGQTVVSEDAVSDYYCSWMDTEHLYEGEECTVEDLMDYLLIVSGNEAATVLAEYVAGDIPTFIKMMNAKAAELGMKDTVYNDPHGLSALNTVTCNDMLLLVRYAMQNETFRSIVRKTEGEMPVSNKRTAPLRYETTNRVLNPKGVEEYETGFSQDILGIKTGSTDAAGLNLSCCMKNGDLTFYSVVMHCKGFLNDRGDGISGHFSSTAELMEWARSFKKVSVSEGDEYSAEVVMIPEDIDFLDRSTIDLPVTAEETVSVLTQKDISDISKTEMKADPSTKKGDVVGSISLTDDFGTTKTVKLIAAESAQTIIDGLKQEKLDAIAAEDALIEQNRGTRLEYIEYAIGFVLVAVLTVIAVKAKKKHIKPQ